MGNTVNKILAKAQRKKSRKTPTRLATHPAMLDVLHVKRITTNGRKKGYQQNTTESRWKQPQKLAARVA